MNVSTRKILKASDDEMKKTRSHDAIFLFLDAITPTNNAAQSSRAMPIGRNDDMNAGPPLPWNWKMNSQSNEAALRAYSDASWAIHSEGTVFNAMNISIRIADAMAITLSFFPSILDTAMPARMHSGGMITDIYLSMAPRYLV